ncbi:Carbonic anhydrase [Alloactinosynnema sp. L-07]|nr:Carbonic anhydrase [Alloactinosynnema sp. L-07]
MTGQQQSPINIRHSIPIARPGEQLAINWQPRDQRFVVKKKAYGYRFAPSQDLKDNEQHHSVWLGANEYRLTEVHFHRPSEHWVNDHKFQAELHAVHVRAEDGIRRCAIGVLLNIDDNDGYAPEEPNPPVSFDLTELLPTPDKRSFYRYEGSLTTPDYGERVSWAVMTEPVTVTNPELARFIRHGADDARDPYPLNRRFVLTDHCIPNQP